MFHKTNAMNKEGMYVRMPILCKKDCLSGMTIAKYFSHLCCQYKVDVPLVWNNLA